METEHEFFRRPGFFFDPNAFRIDLYRLLTCFYSSITFARFGAHIDSDVVRDLQGEFEETEITRLLVSIAVSSRIMDDRDKRRTEKFTLECGRLIPDLSKPETTEPLTLREACNKIIHASKFNWDAECLDKEDARLPYPTTRYVSPRMYLYGKKGTQEWKAELDVTEFVRSNAQLWGA